MGFIRSQPRGLSTLFLTEMWERFSYYGMRALLVLFMVEAVEKGGMGLTDKTAAAIYGLYTAAVYLVALPGGWLSDRLFGAQKSVWYGGIIIALGHFTLAVPGTKTFFLGLVLVVLGTGLLKPNISAIVGELYPEGGARRDAGFTIFYMGINLGATIGPLICSYLGEKWSWHYGFGAAGVGMTLGLIQYRFSVKHLGQAGARPGKEGGLKGAEQLMLLMALGGLAILVAMSLFGFVQINPIAVARWTSSAIVAVSVLYFGYILGFTDLTKVERPRVGVIVILFIGAVLFWAGFEQCGSSLNLFAQRHTIRNIGGYTIPAGWFQSLGPGFVITIAPVMAFLWVKLAQKNLNPSVPAKFGAGLVILGIGFLVMAAAALPVAKGHQVWPTWLIATYFLHTVGELCLSPVGLSSVTKLAPRRLVGQMMGTWFLAASLGNLIAGIVAGEFNADALDRMPGQFMQMVLLPVVAGVVLLALARYIKRWMAGVV